MQNHLLRDSLLIQMDAIEDVVVIDAPNGFGKSVLVSQFAVKHPQVLVVRLNERHAFIAELVKDIFMALKEHGLNDDLLELTPSKALIQMFRSVSDQILVLDGANFLSADGLLALRQLVSSEQLKRLVITTHDYESLNFGRFEDRVRRISASQLLFSAKDIGDLAKQLGVTVDVPSVLQDTAGRGQFVALTLAAVRNKRPTRRVYIDLVEDLYAQDPDFFNKISQMVLMPTWDQKTPGLFGLVFEGDYISQAMALDVPLLPINDGMYQLHQIFRETLFERFPLENRHQLYAQSAQVLEQQKNLSLALRYFNLAGENTTALRLLKELMITAETTGDSMLMETVIGAVDFDQLVIHGYQSGDEELQSIAGFVDVFRAFVSFNSLRPDVGADQLVLARERALPGTNSMLFRWLDIVHASYFFDVDIHQKVVDEFHTVITEYRYFLLYNYFASRFAAKEFFALLDAGEKAAVDEETLKAYKQAADDMQVSRLIFSGQLALAQTIQTDLFQEVLGFDKPQADFFYEPYLNKLLQLAFFRGDFERFFDVYRQNLEHISAYHPSSQADAMMWMVAYHQLTGDWKRAFELMRDVLSLVEDYRIDAAPYKLAMYEIEFRLGQYDVSEFQHLIARIKPKDTYARVLLLFYNGQVAFKTGQWQAATEQFEQVANCDMLGFRFRALHYLKYVAEKVGGSFQYSDVWNQLTAQMHSSFLLFDAADLAQTTSTTLPVFYDFFCRTLGQHELVASGQKVRFYPQQMQLLVYILREGSIRKQDALDIFFSAAKDPNALLKNVVSQLRKTLADCLPSFAARASETVIFQDNSYSLNKAINGQLDLTLLPTADDPFDIYRGAFFKYMDLPDSEWLSAVRLAAWLTLEDRVRALCSQNPALRLPLYSALLQYQFDFNFPHGSDPEETYFDRVVKIYMREGTVESTANARKCVQSWLDACEKYGIRPPSVEIMRELGLDTSLVA